VGLFTVVPGPVALSLGIDLVVYTALYILVWLLLPNGGQTVREMLEVAKDLLPTPRGAKDNRDGQQQND
jgi:hypothetical protein